MVWNKGLTKIDNPKLVRSLGFRLKRAETLKKKKLEAQSMDCPNCKELFQPGTYNQKFCCWECGEEFRKNTKNGLSCEVCSKELIGKQKHVCSEECKSKLSSIIQIGCTFSKERNLKISATLKKRILSEESKQNIKRGQLNRVYTKPNRCFNTKPELKMKEVLKNLNRVYKPQQHVAGLRIDFLLEDLNLVIEVDGSYWHGNPAKYAPDFINKALNMTAAELQEKDRQRDQALKAAGYRIIRFWDKDFNEEQVREAIEQHCWQPVEGLLI